MENYPRKFLADSLTKKMRQNHPRFQKYPWGVAKAR